MKLNLQHAGEANISMTVRNQPYFKQIQVFQISIFFYLKTFIKFKNSQLTIFFFYLKIDACILILVVHVMLVIY